MLAKQATGVMGSHLCEKRNVAVDKGEDVFSRCYPELKLVGSGKVCC